MGNSRIEWTEATWNPVTGCTPISEGCEHCYAKRMAIRLRGRCGYPEKEPFQVTVHPDRFKEPLLWRKPKKIFVCSMGDLFHEDVEEKWISSVMLAASLCSRHTFLLLTKRPERMRAYFQSNPFGYSQGQALGEFPMPLNSPQMRRDRLDGEGTINGNGDNEWPLPNLWLGVTAENQRRADERIPVLLEIPAVRRFVSVEPMLGPVDLFQWLGGDRQIEAPHKFNGGLDWVICGGETGQGARYMLPGWVRDLRDQCKGAGVPFFFKKWGGYYRRIEKRDPGRILDGRTWDEEPEDVKISEEVRDG